MHKKGEADKGVAHPLTSVNFISIHFIIARDGTRQFITPINGSATTSGTVCARKPPHSFTHRFVSTG